MRQGKYRIAKAIPLGNGEVIKEGLDVYYLHGAFYMDAGLLEKSYQEDFAKLLESEETRGWKYLKPIDVV